jgi:hypothetical protein
MTKAVSLKKQRMKRTCTSGGEMRCHLGRVGARNSAITSCGNLHCCGGKTFWLW